MDLNGSIGTRQSDIVVETDPIPYSQHSFSQDSFHFPPSLPQVAIVHTHATSICVPLFGKHRHIGNSFLILKIHL